MADPQEIATLVDQRNACREAAAELRAGVTDCSTVSQAGMWDRRAAKLTAEIIEKVSA